MNKIIVYVDFLLLPSYLLSYPPDFSPFISVLTTFDWSWATKWAQQ